MKNILTVLLLIMIIFMPILSSQVSAAEGEPGRPDVIKNLEIISENKLFI